MKYFVAWFGTEGIIPKEAIPLKNNASLIGQVVTSGKLHSHVTKVDHLFLVPYNCTHVPIWSCSDWIEIETLPFEIDTLVKTKKYMLVSFGTADPPAEAISLRGNAKLIGMVLTSGQVREQYTNVEWMYLVPSNCKHAQMWFHGNGDIKLPGNIGCQYHGQKND